MKVLVLTTSYPLRPRSVSGAFVRETLRGLVPLGIRFEVLTPAAAAPGTPAPEPGIVVREVPYWGARLGGGLAHTHGIPEALALAPWKWALAPALVGALERAAEERLQRGGFDLVWSHWLFPGGAIGARIARRRGAPHLATAHGADVCWLERLGRVPGARRVLARLWSRSALVAPAAHTARRVGLVLGRADVRVAALPTAIEAREPGRGLPRLLYLGRFERIKGPDLLLEALAAIPAGSFCDLTLAGSGSLEVELKRRAARIATPVRFAGVVEGAHKEAALGESHALVLPSRRLGDGRIEGLPHAALEALAAGRALVAPREGALAELVQRTGAGVLYDAPADDRGRVRALAAALLDLARRPARLRELCARARSAGEAFRAPRALAPWHERLLACAGGA